MRSRHFQRGLTMLELLIAMFLMIAALVGLASLQITSIQSSHSAHFRSLANMLATDIIERMHANETAAIKGEYDFAANASTPSGSKRSEQDLREWLSLIAKELPEGKGTIERSKEGEKLHLFIIKIIWNDTRGEITGSGSESSNNNIKTFEYRAVF